MQASSELGVHPMTVSKWERGVQPIPEPVAKLLGRFAAERKSAKSRK
jgi:DNA-binding transcriptional regulator YiaG